MMTSRQTKDARLGEGVTHMERTASSVEQWERQRGLIRVVRENLLQLRENGYQDLQEPLIENLCWVLEDEHRRIGMREGFPESPPAEVDEAKVEASPQPVESTGGVSADMEWFESQLKQPRRPGKSIQRDRRPPGPCSDDVRSTITNEEI